MKAAEQIALNERKAYLAIADAIAVFKVRSTPMTAQSLKKRIDEWLSIRVLLRGNPWLARQVREAFRGKDYGR